MERGVFVSTATAELTNIDELLERYELEVLPSKKSHADVRSRLGIINRLIGFYSAAALTPKVVAAYRDERLTKVKGHTVRKELHLIGRILKHAQKEWEINLPRGNPVDSVTIPSQPKGRERRLQSREEKKLLEAVNAFQAECSLDHQGGARFRPGPAGRRTGISPIERPIELLILTFARHAQPTPIVSSTTDSRSPMTRLFLWLNN